MKLQKEVFGLQPLQLYFECAGGEVYIQQDSHTEQNLHNQAKKRLRQMLWKELFFLIFKRSL